MAQSKKNALRLGGLVSLWAANVLINSAATEADAWSCQGCGPSCNPQVPTYQCCDPAYGPVKWNTCGSANGNCNVSPLCGSG